MFQCRVRVLLTLKEKLERLGPGNIITLKTNEENVFSERWFKSLHVTSAVLVRAL